MTTSTTTKRRAYMAAYYRRNRKRMIRMAMAYQKRVKRAEKKNPK